MNQPVKGKTYSLFGNMISTNFFFERIAGLTDLILEDEQLHPLQLLDYLQQKNRRPRYLLNSMPGMLHGPRYSRIVEILHSALQEFVHGVEEHLASVRKYKVISDRDLLARREQYYLYMIEFELINRIHKEAFLASAYRIALMPYCLKETQDHCRAEPDHLDFRCRGCIDNCYVNRLSQVLRKNSIEPYIWRNARLKPMFTRLVREHENVGVLGIACIVELVRGMRRVMKTNLPVVGIPLNANRCPRWMGSFHETSVDLNALERLVSPADEN